MMAENKKSPLAYERKNGWLAISETEKNLVFDFAEDYKKFISSSKTERETVENLEKEALKMGFKELSQSQHKPGEKIYIKNGNRNIMFVIIGKEPIEKGINIVASHVDSPRLDLKPLPLIEDSDMALLKTHYYGGVKKYQ
jgi:aspartyl aminopeptidase